MQIYALFDCFKWLFAPRRVGCPPWRRLVEIRLFKPPFGLKRLLWHAPLLS